MAEREHAILSASAAHRWLECTPSAMLEAIEDVEPCSTYAEEGTAAHALAELKLSKMYGKIDTETYQQRFEEFVKEFGKYYNNDFEEYVNQYLDFVKKTTDELVDNGEQYHIFFEAKVSFANIVPQGFGTADVLIITDDTIHVIDLKFGVGVPVSAVDNPQLRLYGFGALNMFPKSERIKMTINQPRLDSISTDEMSKADLVDWAYNYVAPRAEQAIKGEGKLHSTEKACKFCKLKDRCRARADAQLAIAKKEFEMVQDETTKMPISPELMSPEQLSDILEIGPAFIDWFNDVKRHAVDQLRAGVKIPGFKLVEGRSNRVITDPDKVREILVENGFDEEDLMEPPKMKGISKLEALVGKKLFGTLCEDYIIKPEGPLTLASSDDRRPEANTLVLAQSEFSTPVN